jgi:multiple sugar transport system substrate-binding protein
MTDHTFGLSRRRALAGGLSTLAAAGVAACGSSSSASKGSSSSSAGSGSGSGSGSGAKATLNVAFFGTQTAADATSKVADTFRKANPGVAVNFTATQGTDWNQFFSKLLTQIAGGTIPDVIQVATEGLQLFADKNLAAPLDSYVKKDAATLKPYFADVHPSLVEAMMYKGSLYAMPTDFNAGNMYLDTSLMQTAGLSYPSTTWTIDDFHTYATKMTKGSAVGFDWVVRLWGSWTSFMYANGANLLTEGKSPGGDWLWSTFYPTDPAAKGRSGGWNWGAPTANDAGVVEALDYMVQLKKAGLSPSPDVGGGGTLQGLFASNRIGMAIGGGFWAGGLQQAGMKNGAFDAQFFPKWKIQRHLFGTGGYTLSAQSKNPELAWELLKSLVTPDAIDVICAGNTTTPTRKSMMTASRYASTGPAHWQTFYDTLTEYPNTAPIPAPPYYNALANSLNQRTTQAMASGDAKSALDDMQRDLETAAAQSGS